MNGVWRAKQGAAIGAIGLRLLVSLALMEYLSVAVACAAVVVEIESDPGDPVGGGMSYRLEADDPSIAFRTAFNSLYLTVAQPADNGWIFEFLAPHHADLTPGLYRDARLLVYDSPVWPLMRISRFDGACGDLRGDFAVFEVELSADREYVTKLAVDFRQQCSGSSGGLRGALRFNSDVALAAPTPTPVAATPTPEQLSPLVLLFGQTGAGVIQGPQRLSPVDGDFTVTHFEGYVGIDFDAGTSFWSLVLTAPLGSELVPGTYEEMQLGPSPHFAGLVLSGEGRACSGGFGRMVVHEAEYGDSGEVERLAVDFELHCDAIPPAIFGSVRIHSERPIPDPPAPTPTPDPQENFFEVSLDLPADQGGFHDLIRSDEGFMSGALYTTFSGTTLFSIGITAPMRSGRAVTLAPPACTDLAAGRYDHVGQWPFQPPEDAGLLFVNCGGPPSNFDLLEYDVDRFGQLYGLDLRFETYCSEGSPPYVGHVKYHSTLPTRTPALPTPTPAPGTSMGRIYSDPGDWVGICREHWINLADGAFFASTDSGLVQISYRSAVDDWDFQFFAPAYQLGEGTFATDHEFIAVTDDSPAMTVAANSHGCDRASGTFTVKEAAYGDPGVVERFAVEFEYHCERGEPALRGWLYYNSTLPEPSPAMPTATTARPSNTPTPTRSATPTITATPSLTYTPTSRPTNTPRPTATSAPASGGGGGCSAGADGSPPATLAALALAVLLSVRRRLEG